MQHTLTNEELRAEYVRVMGRDLGCLCYELRGELDWLRHKWSEFQEIFEQGTERIDLLNRVASNFFYFLHKLLFEDAMLHLCCLTDPPKTLGYTNLTLMSLADLMPDDESFSSQVQNHAKEVRNKCEFAHKWRNKRLAHIDLLTLRKEQSSPLPGVMSRNVEDALKAMSTLLDSVEQHYGLPQSVSFHDPWGARSLVHYLERAIRAIDSERERWGEGMECQSGGS